MFAKTFWPKNKLESAYRDQTSTCLQLVHNIEIRLLAKIIDIIVLTSSAQ